MEDKLRKYVDGLFAETVPTRRAIELKEEMIQNLEDKYNDLIAEGKTPESAYNIAVAGIGDVSGLLDDLQAPEPDIGNEALELVRHKSAMLTAVAVMMYIVSFLPMLFLNLIGVRRPEVLGLPVMFVLIAAATGLLVYNGMTRPRTKRQADTMVEEFREWQQKSHNSRSLRLSVSAALWSVLVALFFIISFSTGAWHITWIVFVFGVAIEAVINIFSALRR